MTPKPPSAPMVGRLPRSRRMTICIGVLFNGGYVIAADTEETTGESKRDQQKLFHFLNGDGPPHPGTSIPPGIIAILTGAGEAGYLDAFYYSLSRDAIGCKNIREFERYFSGELASFHKQHIFPISTRGESPQIIQVMAAVTCGWGTALFVTNGSTVRRCTFHTAIGFGSHFAQGILNQHSWCKSREEAQLLAAYVVHATKGHVVSCGLHTSISTLHDCLTDYDEQGNPVHRQPNCPLEVGFDDGLLRKWEALFDTKWKSRQKALLAELIAEELSG